MFLIIDNYDSFTYNLVQAFYSIGHKPLVLKNDDPYILEIAKDPALKMVCISPGPGHPKDAKLCIEFLNIVSKETPILGVCLGHQLLGLVGGADVVVAPVIMHGKSSDIVHDGSGLFYGLPNPMEVGRYHSLVVDSSVNKKSCPFTVNAHASEGEIMALTYNDRPWVGIQFHPESVLTPDGMRLLSNFPENILKNSSSKSSDINEILNTLANREDLSAEMANTAFASLMDGKMTQAQAGSFLMGLRVKGESPLEMAQATRVALERSMRVDHIEGSYIEVVGTGGDARSSFNCSTATALTLAAMGYKVVKHGNRKVSSKCGSADALEGLGFDLNTPPSDINETLNKDNFVFLFAQHFHPSFKNISSIRNELGIRTLFNLIGPLINPSRPTHILLGVAKMELLKLMAQTLAQSHIKHAAVVHGAGGYDEITPLGINNIILIKDGVMEELELDPLKYNIKPCSPDELSVRSKEEAIDVLGGLLGGQGSKAMNDMLILNVGMGIYLLEDSINLGLAILKAEEAVKSGVGRLFLNATR